MGQGDSTPRDTPGVIGEVTWIADGDTLEVATADGALTVRLVAMNAPERGDCHADEALDHLIDTISGASVRLEIIATDQFDRALAHLFDGDRHLNLEMVSRGLAVAGTPDQDDPYGQTILDAEEHAYENRIGLWNPEACASRGEFPALTIDAGSSEPDPEGPDHENLGAELIVIRNDGDTVVDLEGWTIRDESSRHRFLFMAGMSISPGDEMLVTSDSPPWDPGGTPVWNNDGDMALLQNADGAVVARWRY
jgi:endonuclease YncB( thermonuclease family)